MAQARAGKTNTKDPRGWRSKMDRTNRFLRRRTKARLLKDESIDGFKERLRG